MLKYKKHILYGVLVALLIVFVYIGLQYPPVAYPELRDIQRHAGSFAELTKFFTVIANQKGAEYAFRVLKAAELPPNTDLHLLAHTVGDVLYKQKGADGIAVCTEDFRNACSHSVVVNLFYEKGDDALSDIADACKKAPGGTGAYTMCYHGLGHGILAYAGYELPKAVELCKKTGTKEYNNREHAECVGGTIMEIIGGGFHDRAIWEKQRRIYLKNDDSLYPCSSDFISNEARGMCYVYLTPHLFEAAGADLGWPLPEHFQKAFLFCNKIPLADSQNRDACYGGFGKEFVVLAKVRDIRKVEQMSDKELVRVYGWCRLADNQEGTRSCIFHAVQSLYWGGENNRGTAVRFCRLVSNTTYQISCFERLIGAVGFYIKDQYYRNSFCSELPYELQENCKSRLGTPR